MKKVTNNKFLILNQKVFKYFLQLFKIFNLQKHFFILYQSFIKKFYVIKNFGVKIYNNPSSII